MRGFATEALVLFPKLDNYANRSPSYKFQFRKAVTNLTTYFIKMGIQPFAFYTDDVARELLHPNIMFINPLGDADSFFIKKYCDKAADAMSSSMRHYPEIEAHVLAKDPGRVDMSVNERFEMVLRHTNKAVNEIIPTFKVVAHFNIPKKAQYKLASKPNDGKIRMIISANNFAPKVYMSGELEDACDLLGVGYANRTLDMWEVS